MRILLLTVLLWCGWWLPLAYAEHQVVMPRGNMQYPSQCHDDLVAVHPVVCRGTVAPDCFGLGKPCQADPPCRFEFTATELRITVPDSITEAQVRKVVSNYVARPQPEFARQQRRQALRAKLKAGTLTDAELEELLP